MSFYDVVEGLIREDDRFVTDDGTVLKNSVYEAAMNMDEKLIKLLLANEETKAHFFKNVDGVMVFDKVGFGWLINNRQFLPNSYTRFKNKIGLADETGEMISSSGKVELVFPYKDCILEGGQTADDQKRDEIFYNPLLAPHEIDRLLYPKVFTGAAKYDSDGSENVAEIGNDDNLIIKGNNLLALASLLRRFEGKVRCIYIDPPYYFNKTKPADAFKYNSNFKLSAWLVFMKDRLSMAKRLLASDGVILCHIGEDGMHWTKVLMEEIFGADNFVETFIWKNTDNPDSLSKKSRQAVEYIICFEKKKDTSRQYIGKEAENGDAPLLNSGNSIHSLVFPAGSIHFNIPDGEYKAGKPDRVEIMNDFSVKDGVNVQEVTLKGEFKWGQPMMDSEIAKGTYFIVKSEKFSVRFQRQEAAIMAPEKFFDEQYLSKAIGVGTNEDANSHLNSLGIDFSYSKPESVVAFFLRAVTKERDLVLDFFLGSGTTAAVAHKMNRQYIGIDQMDYIETVAVERLKKVIAGEQGGISQSVNWNGGGSFIYCELVKSNMKYVDEIQAAESFEQIMDIYNRIVSTGFISNNIDPQSIDENIDDFKDLSIENQKRFLMELLDMNLLYVNYSDIDDEEYAINECDKAFTKSFYREG